VRRRLATPPGFDFRRTVFSHGWYALEPFVVPDDAAWLETTVALPSGAAATIRLEPAPDGVVLTTPGRRLAVDARFLVAAARRMLGLDLDLRPFWDSARARPETAWMAEARTGRMLRAPTAWEDLVKLVLTTNCSWALTTRMCAAAVSVAGRAGAGGRKAFPTPSELAALGARGLRQRVGTGYRAPLLAELARRVASGVVEPAAWDTDPRAPAEIKREMLALPGVGPYVAENLLRLGGRPDGPALDSWLRAKYARVYHGGRSVRDRTIARRYARFGAFAGLALWCDMTRDWFDEDERSELGAAFR
jgi:N-glycosylase/DNA lyase